MQTKTQVKKLLILAARWKIFEGMRKKKCLYEKNSLVAEKIKVFFNTQLNKLLHFHGKQIAHNGTKGNI